MRTETGYYPEYRGDQEVREGTQHGHKELGFMVNTTPWFECLEPRSSWWRHGNDFDVFGVSLFAIGVWCWCDYNDAFVGRLLDKDECEDEECACKGEFHVEVQSMPLSLAARTWWREDITHLQEYPAASMYPA